MYAEILVPPSVFSEVAASRLDAPGAAEVRRSGWIHVREVEAKTTGLVTEVRPDLDALASIAGFRISEGLRARVLEVTGEIQP